MKGIMTMARKMKGTCRCILLRCFGLLEYQFLINASALNELNNHLNRLVSKRNDAGKICSSCGVRRF
jgi:hypothetical protein